MLSKNDGQINAAIRSVPKKVKTFNCASKFRPKFMLQNRSEITNLGNCETKRKVKLSNIFKTLKHGKSAAETKKQNQGNLE